MTDQAYKLVPVEPTDEMLDAMTSCYNNGGFRAEVYGAAIAAAPDPGCRWTPAERSLGLPQAGWFWPGCTDDTAIRIECMNSGSPGYMVKPKACPFCGKKVEVVREEKP